MPHMAPSVTRVHEPITVDIEEPHAPDVHEWIVTGRERVPVVSHVEVKPPHALHVPYVVTPQEVPSGSFT